MSGYVESERGRGEEEESEGEEEVRRVRGNEKRGILKGEREGEGER